MSTRSPTGLLNPLPLPPPPSPEPPSSSFCGTSVPRLPSPCVCCSSLFLYGSQECGDVVAVRLWISINAIAPGGPSALRSLLTNRAGTETGSSEQGIQPLRPRCCFIATGDGGRDNGGLFWFCRTVETKGKSSNIHLAPGFKTYHDKYPI